MHSFVRRLTLAAVALPLLLGGCAEDEPDTSPPDPTTSPPSVSEPVEPTLPPQAEGTGPEAAEAFLRHYYATMDHARQSGSTASLATLALDTCRSCDNVVKTIDRVERRGGSITGGDQTLLRARLRNAKSRNGDMTYSGSATVASTRQVIENSGDPEMDGTYPAGNIKLDVRITRTEQGWRFAEWYVVSS